MELLRTLPIRKKNRGSDLKKRKVAEFAIMFVPEHLNLDLIHSFGFSMKRLASFNEVNICTARKEYNIGVNQFTGVLRRQGWIRRSKGKWIFDPERTMAARRDDRVGRFFHIGAWILSRAPREQHPWIISEIVKSIMR